MRINKKFIFIFGILLLEIVSAGNVVLDYPEEFNINEEFEINLEITNFSEDIYDVKIDILCNEIRISRILNEGVWKSTNYYVNNIIENNKEKGFKLKTEKICDEAEIIIKIRNSKDKIETFSNYKIKSIEDEEPENSNEDDDKEEEEIEDEEKEKTKIEISEKTESSYEKVAENISFKPIVLNAQNIKSVDDKKFLTENWALCGVIFFCIVFGALFLFKTRKYKNEFQ